MSGYPPGCTQWHLDFAAGGYDDEPLDNEASHEAPLTCPELCHAAELMYGIGWRTPLAIALDVSERTVRSWATSRDPIPDGIRNEMISLCHNRVNQIMGAITTLTQR
jgi:hypothetical protein